MQTCHMHTFDPIILNEFNEKCQSCKIEQLHWNTINSQAQKLDVSQLTVFCFESGHQFEEQKHLGDNANQLLQCVLD